MVHSNIVSNNAQTNWVYLSINRQQHQQLQHHIQQAQTNNNSLDQTLIDKWNLLLLCYHPLNAQQTSGKIYDQSSDKNGVLEMPLAFYFEWNLFVNFNIDQLQQNQRRSGVAVTSRTLAAALNTSTNLNHLVQTQHHQNLQSQNPSFYLFNNNRNAFLN